MTRLVCTGVRAGYRKEEVIHGIDLTVGGGEILSVVGPNGSGKTTLLLTLAGILSRRSGTVVLDDVDLPSGRPVAASKRGLVLVPDDRSLFPSMSVCENIEVARRRGSQPARNVLEIFPALDRRWGIAAGALSGGEAQMLALARAFIQNPTVLLIDEMSMGLAPVIVQQLLEQVSDIAQQHQTAVVLVEQHVSLALKVAHKVIVMTRGEVAVSGSAEDVGTNMDAVHAAHLGVVSA